VSVVAYRTWNVSAQGLLTGVGVTVPWLRAKVTARCDLREQGRSRRFHLPPNPSCRCGIYAWKRPVDPERIDMWSQQPPSEIAVGVVLLWGRMCDGAAMTGHRAQHARIVALVGDELGRLDRDRYPVRYYPNLTTMYGDWDVSPGDGWARDSGQ
jgi:hypothetical protein